MNSFVRRQKYICYRLPESAVRKLPDEMSGFIAEVFARPNNVFIDCIYLHDIASETLEAIQPLWRFLDEKGLKLFCIFAEPSVTALLEKPEKGKPVPKQADLEAALRELDVKKGGLDSSPFIRTFVNSTKYMLNLKTGLTP